MSQAQARPLSAELTETEKEQSLLRLSPDPQSGGSVRRGAGQGHSSKWSLRVRCAPGAAEGELVSDYPTCSYQPAEPPARGH